jgi:cytochrome c-type biogenesis protein CcmE
MMNEQDLLNKDPATVSALRPMHKRFMWIVLALVIVMAVTALVLNAFSNSITYFYSPTEVVEHKVPEGRAFRIGGMVVDGTLRRAENGLTVNFEVTDSAHNVPASYTGILPDLFAEGKGVVALGKMDENGVFQATQVLAKHDENYVAPEVAAAMDEAHKNAILKTME